MIVISGALVLVALVLLIIGVVGPDLAFVYASIAVSLVSLVFLVIGILQRRGEAASTTEPAAAPAAAPAEQSAEGVTAVIPSQAARWAARKDAQEPPAAETADEELGTGGTVLIVEGRPRYHVEGCRYLAGKDAEKIDVLDAREEGFSPCGVCKPDAYLEQQDAAAGEPVVEEDVPPVTRAAASGKAAAKKAPAKKAPAKTAAVKAPAAKAAARKEPAAKAPSKAAAAAPAAASAAKTGSVVVIPDRGRYHRPECRYVRDVDGAEAMSKTAARRDGYAACGVCKP